MSDPAKYNPAEFIAAVNLLTVLLRNGPRKADHCESVAKFLEFDLVLFRHVRDTVGIEESNYTSNPDSEKLDHFHVLWHFGKLSQEEIERWGKTNIK